VPTSLAHTHAKAGPSKYEAKPTDSRGSQGDQCQKEMKFTKTQSKAMSKTNARARINYQASESGSHFDFRIV